MKLKLLTGGLLAGVLCVSCGPNDPNAAGQKRGKTLAGAADTTKASARSGKTGELRLPDAPIERPTGGGSPLNNSSSTLTGAANTPTDTSDIPLAPKDARWTIYCAGVQDANHVETARNLKAALIQRTGMREWYIIHENTRSRIYYGFYRSIDDTAGDAEETKRAQADRKKIDEMVDGRGERPFKACQFVQLSAPDPESPPQWNLVNAPDDRYWTLQVGAYKDHPDRKRAAVEAVREARAAGQEAYYYHGDNVSSVCIGTWREDAVVEERVDSEPGTRKGGDPDLLVLPPGITDPGKLRNKQGEPVRAVSLRLVPIDDGLKQMMAQYPHMGVNGAELVYRRGNKTWLQSSLIVPIPRPGENAFKAAVQEADPAAPGQAEVPDTLSRPKYQDAQDDKANTPSGTRRPAGTGGLRSINR